MLSLASKPLLGIPLLSLFGSQGPSHTGWRPRFVICNSLTLLPIQQSFHYNYCPVLQNPVLYLVPQSCPALCHPMDCSLPGSSVHADSPGKNSGVGCHALLWGIFPTRGSQCRSLSSIAGGFFYCLSHQGSPRILEWVAYPFSRRSSRPRN